MGNNHFTGNIPTDIGKLSKLGRLGLQNIQLSGSIPSSLGNLKMLTILLLQGNNLEGSIPSSLGECHRLLLLNLLQNNLGGAIPQQIIALPSLSVSLDLSRNHFVGPFPLEDGNLKNLSELDVSNNVLSGELSGSFGNCVSLEVLHLQGNLFKGQIPSSFISLERIQDFDISRNNLIDLLKATDGFASAYLIGDGSFGSVYKGVLLDDDREQIVAVKVLNMLRRGASKSFIAKSLYPIRR
ncbi:hypothetical protein C1H46_004051 [Malus baccata]|uniref:Protein kinase domain-containing protein n=1 Tax=Malus baccata TaxID=106549 RepID=A0A540NH54_MALBA|nr:hypothetical protein C1H46_004051 [Malus baccata]